MSGWRNGRFDRSKIPAVWHPFTPAHAVARLEDIDLQELFTTGKRLLLLDVDHTLVMWRAEEFSESVTHWIEKAKALGFDICIISNTRRLERLARIKKRLGVETVRGKFKPSAAMYRLAMIKFHRKPEEAIMIGDQLLTDILGANRSGIEAIWVQKMEGPEFIGTKVVNRTMERFFRGFIYEALSAPPNEAATPLAGGGAPRSTLHQFIRFVLVGVTSFVIDFSIRWVMLFHVPYNGTLLSHAAGSSLRQSAPWMFAFANTDVEAFVPLAAGLGTSVAIVNSFIWNRIWTFEIRGKVERSRQFRRFFAISAIGGGLNVLLSTEFVRALPFDAQWNVRIATVFAAAIVAIWNFAGSKMYAFKPATP